MAALTVGLSPLVTAPAALAQTGISNNYAISVLPTSSQYTADRAVFGEYNATSLLDVALLRGSELTLAYDPSLGEAGGDVEGSFADLASYHGLSEATADGLLVVGAAMSMSELVWNPSTSTFDPAPVFLPGTAGNIICTGLTRLDVGQIDGQLDSDIVVVRADRRSLRLVKGVGYGEFVMTPPQLFSATLAGDVVDVCIVDGDGTGGGHVFGFSESDLLVVNSMGQNVLETRFDGTIIGAETISAGQSGQENCAVLLESFSGKSLLYVLDGETLALNQIVDVTNLSPTQITAGDYDSNGTTDLAVTAGWSHGLMCMLQGSNGNILPVSMAVPLGGPTAPSVAPGSSVAIMDVEGDGDRDALYPVALRDQVYMAKNAEFDHRELAPRILNTGRDHVWSPSGDAVSIRYEWLGSSFQPPGTLSLPTGATHLQVMVWASLRTSAIDYETQPVPLTDVALTLATYPYETNALTPYAFAEIELDPFATIDPVNDLAFVTARYIRLDSTGAIERAWPHHTIYLASVLNPDGQAYLDSLPFTSADLRYFNYDPFYQASGGTEVGGGGATGCVPDYPPNAPPPQGPPPVVL